LPLQSRAIMWAVIHVINIAFPTADPGGLNHSARVAG
jgi:hypothetical protein